MPTFDASPYADRHPVSVLRVVRAELGDVLLIGAVAVDVICHDIAGLPLGRLTRDVDVAVAMPDRESFERCVRRLHGTTGASAKIVVEGVRVDIVPFGGLARGDVVEHDGDQLVVAGMNDAYRTATSTSFAPGVELRTPSLAALLALKIISWAERRHDTGKDAGDIARLLQAAGSGPYGAALWEDEQALEACEFDPIAAGPWRLGRQIAADFDGGALARVREALIGESRQLLMADAPRAFSDPGLQLEALHRGLTPTG